MKCPKCGGRMIYEEGGYFRSNIKDGFGTPMLESLSCIICGKYIESKTETEIPKELKNELKSKYPELRQSLGSPCWLQDYVRKNYYEIYKLKKEKTWGEICSKLSKRDTVRLIPDSLSTAFRKVRCQIASHSGH